MTAATTGLLGILDAREARWLRRRELCRKGPLLSVTMNIPGPDKNLPRWNAAHACIVALLRERLGPSQILYFEEHTSPAGTEAHFVTSFEAEKLKRTAIDWEKKCIAAALADLDVLDTLGRPVSRHDLGLPARRCWCCAGPAKICVRERRHPLTELLEEGERLLDAWRGAERVHF